MDKQIKKDNYSKILNSILNLLVWNNELPKSMGNLDIKLSKKELKRLKNIVWYIQNKKLWK
tara:strand:- start:215 stop:397 length:183 start_codon:yes stop_codon:yes gene_type:complete